MAASAESVFPDYGRDLGAFNPMYRTFDTVYLPKHREKSGGTCGKEPQCPTQHGLAPNPTPQSFSGVFELFLTIFSRFSADDCKEIMQTTKYRGFAVRGAARGCRKACTRPLAADVASCGRVLCPFCVRCVQEEVAKNTRRIVFIEIDDIEVRLGVCVPPKHVFWECFAGCSCGGKARPLGATSPSAPLHTFLSVFVRFSHCPQLYFDSLHCAVEFRGDSCTPPQRSATSLPHQRPCDELMEHVQRC